MTDVVRWEERDGAVVWTVDRPRTRNAVDPEVHAALAAAVDRAERTASVRAIVLTGAGSAFLSGGDLRFIHEHPAAETLRLSADMGALLDRLEALPVPVFAAINGVAFGGGAEIAMACDYRIAEASARVSFRQAAMGLTTGWGATQRLARAVPRSVAMRLTLTAEVLDAAEASRLGVVDEVVADGGAVARALELARATQASSPRAVAAFKRTVRAAYDEDAARARAIEWAEFERLWGGEDHREALDAFFAKRAPRWRTT